MYLKDKVKFKTYDIERKQDTKYFNNFAIDSYPTIKTINKKTKLSNILEIETKII